VTTEKSTNPPTKTAADTTSASSATNIALASGHEGTVRDQIDSYLQRIRGGEMGSLPRIRWR